MEPVGELDQQYADVAGHRHDHLADVLRLLLLTAAEGERVQLREPVDDPGDLGAELLLELLERDLRVLHRVVEQGGHERRRVQAEVGEDVRDRQRVLDEVLAREPPLALVRGLRQRVRPLELLEVGLRVVASGRSGRGRRRTRGPAPPRPGAAARAARRGVRPRTCSRLSTRRLLRTSLRAPVSQGGNGGAGPGRDQ